MPMFCRGSPSLSLDDALHILYLTKDTYYEWPYFSGPPVTNYRVFLDYLHACEVCGQVYTTNPIKHQLRCGRLIKKASYKETYIHAEGLIANATIAPPSQGIYTAGMSFILLYHAIN
jgi:hypothetical protein